MRLHEKGVYLVDGSSVVEEEKEQKMAVQM